MYAAVSVPLHAMLQGLLLGMLRGVPHVVELLASGSCDYDGMMWHAILVAPVVQRLSTNSGLKLFAQVKELHCACAAVLRMH